MPSATIRYHNGAGFENFMEGYIELTSESELDSSEVSEFISEVEEYIEDLNPYIPQIQNNTREVVKNVETPIVADFPCWECGQYGVSINDSFYMFGHCCYCGFDNEVEICDKCGTVFNDDGGKSGLCISCWNEFDKA